MKHTCSYKQSPNIAFSRGETPQRSHTSDEHAPIHIKQGLPRELNNEIWPPSLNDIHYYTSHATNINKLSTGVHPFCYIVLI